MPRGQPDFGMYAVKEVTASISDMGEVAARLGSIVIFDRRGEVVDFDNFEGTLIKGLAAVPSYPIGISLSSETARSGSQCVRLRPADAIDAILSITKGYTPLGSNRLGFEASFTPSDNRARVGIEMDKRTRTLIQVGGIQVDTITGDLYYYNPDGVYTYFTTLGSFHKHISIFYTMKLVLDFATSKYVRFLFGPEEIDVSAFSLERTVSEQAPRIHCIFNVRNKTTSECLVYTDDFIFTQEEP